VVVTLEQRYELRALLGSGAMARVVEAYDRALQREVAIKFLRSDAADAEGRARFVREARAAASLVHPNVVSVYDAGEAARRPYLVMELVRGPSLAAVLRKRGPLALSGAISVADQVLDALAAAHAQGLVHRDVKPSNVLIGGARRVKLTDFGLAKSLHDATAGLTRPGQVLGTPMYLAPERSAGRGATPLSDLYAVGIVLFEMLTGKPPFSAANLFELALAHQQTPVPPLQRADVPASVEAAIACALAKEPEQRYPSARAMQVALRRVAEPAMGRRLARSR
jgi:eukaryotic-like serine/threonine-protein kinase